MPLDNDSRWDDYGELIMRASDAVYDAIKDLPDWAQFSVLGANIETILKPLSEKERDHTAVTFIRTFLNAIKTIDDDDDTEDNACPASSIKPSAASQLAAYQPNPRGQSQSLRSRKPAT